MTRVEYLIKKEKKHRSLAHAHESKSEYHWNKANEVLLEIQAEVEREKELDCSQQSSSMGV